MSNHWGVEQQYSPTRSRPDRSLRNVAFFDRVPGRTVEDIGKRCRWHDLEDGDVLVPVGERPDRVFFVLTGELQFTHYTRLGKSLSLRSAPQGSFVGEATLADVESLSYSVEATRPSLVASVGARTFLEHMERDRELFRAVMGAIVARQDLFAEQAIEMTTLNVHDRVQNELARLSRDYVSLDGSATICPFPKHSELARRIGTHREAVSRAISHLQHLGIVARSEGGLFIPDVTRLRETQLKLWG